MGSVGPGTRLLRVRLGAGPGAVYANCGCAGCGGAVYRGRLGGWGRFLAFVCGVEWQQSGDHAIVGCYGGALGRHAGLAGGSCCDGWRVGSCAGRSHDSAIADGAWCADWYCACCCVVARREHDL
nr:MAG TPA: hypothetical protein [Inoviridae sp.]